MTIKRERFVRSGILLMSLLTILCFGFLSEAHADKSLTFGLWAQHYAGDHTEGLDNHLIALDWDGPTAAFFRNSYGKETGYFGWTWHTDKFTLHDDWWVRGNLSAGVLAGYGTKHPIRVGMFSPGVYPTVNIGKDKYSVGLGVMPTFWWLSFKVEF